MDCGLWASDYGIELYMKHKSDISKQNNNDRTVLTKILYHKEKNT